MNAKDFVTRIDRREMIHPTTVDNSHMLMGMRNMEQQAQDKAQRAADDFRRERERDSFKGEWLDRDAWKIQKMLSRLSDDLNDGRYVRPDNLYRVINALDNFKTDQSAYQDIVVRQYVNPASTAEYKYICDKLADLGAVKDGVLWVAYVLPTTPDTIQTGIDIIGGSYHPQLSSIKGSRVLKAALGAKTFQAADPKKALEWLTSMINGGWRVTVKPQPKEG